MSDFKKTSELVKKLKKKTQFPTKVDLPQKTRSKIVELLNQDLANLMDLYSQTKQAHWNVKGIHFYQLHKLFDDLADNLTDHIDTVAERVATLGGTPLGTVRMAAVASELKEFSMKDLDGESVLECLVENYGKATNSTRKKISIAGDHGDEDSADLFTEVCRDLDKNLWFLESHLV